MPIVTISRIVDLAFIAIFAIFVAIFAIFVAYLYMTRRFLYWKKRGVMEIPPAPFIGNFASCLTSKRSPGELARDLYELSPNLPYMGFYIFDRPFFLVRDVQLIKSMIMRDFGNFTDRSASPHDSLGAAALFFLNNPGWKLMRKKLTPTFSSGQLKKMFELMLGVGRNLKNHLVALNLDERQIMDFKDFCAKYATDVIGATAFGLDVNCLNDPDAEFRKRGREMFVYDLWRGIELTSIFFAPQFSRPFGFRFINEESAGFLRRVFWGAAAERERTDIKGHNLIDRLMDLKKSETDSPVKTCFEFDGDNLVGQALTFFTAGFEPTSSTVSFALYELALAPKIQTVLRREIREALAATNGEITYDLVMNLPYLDMVVSEALRKYPSLPYLDRMTNADYKLPNSDLVLEKGTPVFISILGLHYDPEYFPDPEVFDPERFTAVNKRNRKPYVYMPFGHGPRACIGTRFALLEVKLALVLMLPEYEVSPCEKTVSPIRMDPKAIFMTAYEGLYLNIRKIGSPDDL